MPLDNDPQDPQEPGAPPAPQPAPEPEPQAPQYDVESAYGVIAQHEGWDPRLTKYEMQEFRRRKEEFERERKEWEKLRTRYEPPEDNSDPYMRRISNLERILLEDREEARKLRDRQETERRIENELHSTYTQIARQSGLTPEQMEQKAKDFYGALADLYPEYDIIQRVGVERASRAAFERVARSNGQRTMPGVVGRGPTAMRTIPGSPQPYMGAGNPAPHEENLSAEQLEGETDDQYRARLERIITGAGVRRLPDGTRVTSR